MAEPIGGYRYRYCPKCGSPKLKWASGLPQLESVYDCQECGYRGSLVIEDWRLAKKIRKRWLREKEEKASPASET